MSDDADKPFRFGPSLRVLREGPHNHLIGAVLERLLGLRRLESAYLDRPELQDSQAFIRFALDKIAVGRDIREEHLACIPPSGSTVVVANHPFGALEGLLLADLLLRIRPDVRILANHHLQRIPEMRDILLAVDPFGGNGAVTRSVSALRQAMRWVQDGGMLLVFPAGEVAHLQLRHPRITDPPWNATVARIVKRCEAPVLPMYVEGTNSLLFHLLGLIHPRLRTALLPRELLNKARKTIPVRVGRAIPYAALRELDGNAEVLKVLRLHTFALEEKSTRRLEQRTGGHPGVSTGRALEPIASPAKPALLAREIHALPDTQRLGSQKSLEVYYARAEQIPWTLQEIGRLRETTFRRVGEGTGNAVDIDLYDSYYRHLFVWSTERHEVVGAYRMGLVDEIVPRRTRQGLYTQTLFKLSPRLLNRINPSIEMGRSFVRGEYQRSFTPLMLLWKGIGTFVARHPHYRYLFGPVSISSDYRSISQQLLVAFLRLNNFDATLARQVKARRPFTVPRTANGDVDALTGLDKLSELIQTLEGEGRGVPVLLRQYLKLGGQLLGFNVDPNFSNALDCLMMVDLLATRSQVLNRYMGRDAAERFLAHHAPRDSSRRRA